MDELLKSARHLARMWQEKAVCPGDTVVDATMGNGHDTLALCRIAGPEGHVHAFDLQEEALAATKARLAEAGFFSGYTLHHKGHERMDEAAMGPVRAVVFNLGWLPGGDKSITTRWPTTEIALKKGLGLLMPGGIITLCAYPGHPAGDEELRALHGFFGSLSPREYNVLHQRFLTAGPGAPECFVVERLR